MGYIDDKSANNESYDNSVTALGNGDVQSAIDALSNKAAGGGGVTPPFFFGRPSGGSAGTYLQINGVASNKLGQITAGLNKIVRLSVTSSAVVSGATVIQLQQRTALATFVDIAGALITVASGAYKATSTLSVNLPVDAEISAYIKSGTISDVNIQVYVTAQ